MAADGDRPIEGSPPHRGSIRCRYHEGESFSNLLERLQIRAGHAVVVVVGFAINLPEDERDEIDLVLRESVARPAASEKAIVIYGGTATGVMSLLGHAMAEVAPDCELIGVAPAAMVSFPGEGHEAGDARFDVEPNHTHFVLTDGEAFGSEGRILIGLAERLATDGNVAMVVLGGGSGTRFEVDLALRRAWPVLELFPPERCNHTGGPEITAGMSRAEVRQVVRSDRDNARQLLQWRLNDDELLKNVWLRYVATDAVATRSKPKYRRLRGAALVLGVLLAALAAAAPELEDGWQASGVRVSLVVLGATSTGLAAWIARRRRGHGWVSVRRTAEAMIGEIYRYRAGCEPYGMTAADQATGPSALLAARFARLDQELTQEETVPARHKLADAWPPPELGSIVGTVDRLVGPVAGWEYNRGRVERQLEHFDSRIQNGERQVGRLLVLIYALGVSATVVAAVSTNVRGVEFLVTALAVSATAFASWLEYDRTEESAHRAASTASNIQSGRDRWLSVGREKREVQAAISAFVQEVEDSLEAETGEWARALRDAHRAFMAHSAARSS